MRIPANGRKIYVTLFSYIRGEWHWYDYEYEAPSPVTQDRSVLINITNKLVYGVNFLVNGRVVGSVPAGETRSTTVTVSELRMSYEVIQPALSGRTLGDSMSGSWSNITNPATRYDMTIDNMAGDTTFFAPRVTNRTGTSIALEVNGGLARRIVVTARRPQTRTMWRSVTTNISVIAMFARTAMAQVTAADISTGASIPTAVARSCVSMPIRA